DHMLASFTSNTVTHDWALSHPAHSHELPPEVDHVPCALLVDAALALVVTDHLIAADPAATVGILTPRRAELVAGARLARWAAELEIGPLLRLGRGEDQAGGRTRESILATALEALLGAIYSEAGPLGVR